MIRKGQDFEKALDYLNRALEFDPDNSDAMVGRGVMFVFMSCTGSFSKVCIGQIFQSKGLQEGTSRIRNGCAH